MNFFCEGCSLYVSLINAENVALKYPHSLRRNCNLCSGAFLCAPVQITLWKRQMTVTCKLMSQRTTCYFEYAGPSLCAENIALKRSRGTHCTEFRIAEVRVYNGWETSACKAPPNFSVGTPSPTICNHLHALRLWIQCNNANK